jgi:pilus assembly protein Flp/PilA
MQCGTTGPIPKPELEKDKKMKKFSSALVSFLKNEDGPTAVEYAVMLALIIVVCIAAITTLGTNANNTFTTVGTKIAGS